MCLSFIGPFDCSINTDTGKVWSHFPAHSSFCTVTSPMRENTLNGQELIFQFLPDGNSPSKVHSLFQQVLPRNKGFLFSSFVAQIYFSKTLDFSTQKVKKKISNKQSLVPTTLKVKLVCSLLPSPPLQGSSVA